MAQLEPLPPRTLASVRDQVAEEIAIRTIQKSKTQDTLKIGVTLTFSKSDDISFITSITSSIQRTCISDYLFAIATIGAPTDTDTNIVGFCSSDPECIQRCVLLANAKFIGRVRDPIPLPLPPQPTSESLAIHTTNNNLCIVPIEELGYTTYDEHALWDVVRKASMNPVDPLDPPPNSRSLTQLLSDRRAKLERVTPNQALTELHDPEPLLNAPTLLVDIRPHSERLEHGVIPGSLIIERTFLEASFDPRSSKRLGIADRYDLRIIMISQDGDASSLAAYELHKLGLLNVTDVIGGFEAWRKEGLAVEAPRQIKQGAGGADGSLLLSFGESLVG